MMLLASFFSALKEKKQSAECFYSTFFRVRLAALRLFGLESQADEGCAHYMPLFRF